MNSESGRIVSITTEVTVYPSSFCVPAQVLHALEAPERLYVVVKDVFGNVIHARQIGLTSGPEVKKSDFADHIGRGQLYPGQRIRLEVSLP